MRRTEPAFALPPDAAGTRWLLGSSVVTGTAGLGSLACAGHWLSTEDLAWFLQFWGILFTIFAGLVGVQAEVTRAMVTPSFDSSEPSDTVLATIVFGGALGTIAAAFTALVWSGPDRGLVALLVLLATAMFAMVCAGVGTWSGTSMWRRAALLASVEPMVRLVVLVVGVVLGGRLGATVLGTASGAVTGGVVAACFLRATNPSDVSWTRFVTATRRIALACGASMVSGAMLAGFPALVYLVTDAAPTDHLAALLLALSIARGVFLLPLGAVQNAIVVRFAVGGRATELTPIRVAAVLGVVAAPIAVLAGPQILELMNPAFELSRTAALWSWVGAVLLACITLSGLACITRDLHAVAVLGWVASIAATMLVLTAPLGSVDGRVLASVLIGPTCGLIVHLDALRRAARTHDASPPNLR